MEQLLIHLWGDYITQTDWMAQQKTKSHIPALAHAVTYSIPFLLITTSPIALFVICASHFVIDRWRLARYVVFAKNLVTSPEYKWADCNVTGYHKDSPPWLAFWLLIIADNTLHLTINYLAISYL